MCVEVCGKNGKHETHTKRMQSTDTGNRQAEIWENIYRTSVCSQALAICSDFQVLLKQRAREKLQVSAVRCDHHIESINGTENSDTKKKSFK